MTKEDLKSRNLESEMVFSASRSSGPGGQNVNKVSSRIELRFNIQSTSLLTDTEKQSAIAGLKRRITKEGELLIVSQESRSQLENKILAIERFYDLLAKALTIQKTRIKTRPTKASKTRRVDSKKLRGIVKKFRSRPSDSDS